jgi:hypothetical protein
MENKKLINILLKDMGELEELISEIKSKGEFDLLEIEFLHTRAKGILQLVQMLKNFEPVINTPVEIKDEKVSKEEIIEICTTIEKKEEKEIYNSSVEKTKEIPFIEPVQIEIPEPVELLKTKEVVEIEKETIIHTEILPEIPVDLAEHGIKESNVELEEVQHEANHRLGDSFLKGKSINDLVEDHNKLEFKLSNRPVSNIQAAIGINDRFQYIRELFDGSSEKYSSTVTSLDSMNNINEAVTYLQQNFKWKKNETSLKFINLVKRRFTNG